MCGGDVGEDGVEVELRVDLGQLVNTGDVGHPLLGTRTEGQVKINVVHHDDERRRGSKGRESKENGTQHTHRRACTRIKNTAKLTTCVTVTEEVGVDVVCWLVEVVVRVV